MSDCAFCKIVQGDILARVVGQNERAIAFLDAFPLAAGHTLIVPKTHYVKMQDMPPEDSAAVFSLVREVVRKVESATGTDASLLAIHNGRVAGQEVPHVHVHIIPRKAGDDAGPVHSLFKKPKLTPEDMDTILSNMA